MGEKVIMKTIVYNHRSGLNVLPETQLQKVIGVIQQINPRIKQNAVTEIRDEIIHGLDKEGWSGEYRLDSTSKITITSYQNGIGLCIQTGNISRIYADLLKLQALFLKGNIRAGIIIVPQRTLAVKLASNMANYERIIGEMQIFNQVISMPLVIIGFNEEDARNE